LYSKKNTIRQCRDIFGKKVGKVVKKGGGLVPEPVGGGEGSCKEARGKLSFLRVCGASYVSGRRSRRKDGSGERSHASQRDVRIWGAARWEDNKKRVRDNASSDPASLGRETRNRQS